MKKMYMFYSDYVLLVLFFLLLLLLLLLLFSFANIYGCLLSNLAFLTCAFPKLHRFGHPDGSTIATILITNCGEMSKAFLLHVLEQMEHTFLNGL